MPTRRFSRQALTGDTALIAYVALADFVVHLLVANNYGYFRDELYYIAAGNHLAPGYVDFPAGVALLAALVRVLFGSSLVMLHVIPAIAGALTVLLTGLMARELGGKRFAQGLAALGTLIAVSFLATGSIFSMDSLDQLWWALAAYVLIRLIKADRPQRWLLFGLVAGLGLLTKITMGFFGLALVVGLVLTPQRRYLRSPWLWLGGAIAFAFVLPYILWNAANGWPTVEFWSHYGNKLAMDSAGIFLLRQIYALNPVTLPLWLAGLYFYFRTETGRPYRVLGWAYLSLYVLFTFSGAKPYFLAPAYPMLFAAGAIVFERGVQRPRWHWLRRPYPALMIVMGLLLAPIAMPILPPVTFGQLYGFLGGDAGVQMEQHATGVLPQWLADRFGWTEMVKTVAEVYTALPADEQAQACIFTNNYGEASAFAFFGPAYHLPRAISGHNNFFLWGPGNCSGQVLIALHISVDDLRKTFDDVSQAGWISCERCMPEENDLPVYVARHPRAAVNAVWPSVKHFD